MIDSSLFSSWSLSTLDSSWVGNLSTATGAGVIGERSEGASGLYIWPKRVETRERGFSFTSESFLS